MNNTDTNKSPPGTEARWLIALCSGFLLAMNVSCSSRKVAPVPVEDQPSPEIPAEVQTEEETGEPVDGIQLQPTPVKSADEEEEGGGIISGGVKPGTTWPEIAGCSITHSSPDSATYRCNHKLQSAALGQLLNGSQLRRTFQNEGDHFYVVKR